MKKLWLILTMLDCLQSVLLMCTAYIVQHILMRQYLFSHLLQHSCLQYWHAVIYLRSAVSFVLHILHFSIMSSLALTSPHLLTGKLSAKFYYWECDWHINGLLWKAHQMKRFLSKKICSRLEVWYEDDSLTVISKLGVKVWQIIYLLASFSRIPWQNFTW